MPALTIQQAFDIALQYHQSGRLREAEQLYRQIIELAPQHADALHNLGMLAHQAGQNEIAIDLIRRAVAIKPNFPQAFYNLGNVFKHKGQLDEAIAAYRSAIGINPRYSEAHNNLGTTLRSRGFLDDAIAEYRQAIAIQPDYPQAHSNLGTALREQGDFAGAIAAYRNAISLTPGSPNAYNNLGNALRSAGSFDDAIAAYRQAVALNASYPEAFSNLGNVLMDKRDTDGAIDAYRRAIAINPSSAEIRANLGNALRAKGEMDEAIESFRRAISLNPNLSEFHSNLGNALHDAGRAEEAIAAYRQALALRPDNASAHSNLVYALNFHPDFDAHAIAEEHRQWNQQHAVPLRRFVQRRSNGRIVDRRLRIGYVSPDFRDHAVSRFAMPLLAAHDHDQFEIFCYAQVAAPDAITQKFQRLADGWRSIVGKSDEQVASLILQDRIDILIDLAGHTAGNRLLVFARKPAPIQVTYLGYPATTGLDAIDYRFTDELADPTGLTDRYCSEKLFRLPQTAWCFLPHELSPPVSALPALQNNHITFGSFNNFAKINQPLLESWSEILHRVPRSRLMLKATPLRCESISRKVCQMMERFGISSDRLDLRGWLPAAEHLDLYGHADIALDTYPYHGTTTTCEALWMGVPVITRAGQSHVARVGVSLLSNVGLADLVGQSSEQMVEIAVRLAEDIPRLDVLRRSLRQRMEQSPLMDAPRFARNVEAAYHQTWEKRCEAAPVSQ